MRGGLADADEGPDEETTVLSPAVAPQDCEVKGMFPWGSGVA